MNPDKNILSGVTQTPKDKLLVFFLIWNQKGVKESKRERRSWEVTNGIQALGETEKWERGYSCGREKGQNKIVKAGMLGSLL